jgi:large subunit ribosomal protein L21
LQDQAIITTGGKQYMVSPGDSINIESIEGDVGETIEFSEVLFLSKDGERSIGTPIVKGGKVKAEIVRNAKDKKVIVFKYKNKIRYRKKNGHRQAFTEINIKDILID